MGVRQLAPSQQPCNFGYISEPDFPRGQNGDEEVHQEGLFCKGRATYGLCLGPRVCSVNARSLWFTLREESLPLAYPVALGTRRERSGKYCTLAERMKCQQKKFFTLVSF